MGLFGNFVFENIEEEKICIITTLYKGAVVDNLYRVGQNSSGVKRRREAYLYRCFSGPYFLFLTQTGSNGAHERFRNNEIKDNYHSVRSYKGGFKQKFFFDGPVS